MLLGCRILEELNLYKTTASGSSQQRTITESDLFIPGTISNTASQPWRKRIVAAHVRKLRLKGRWVFNKAVLIQFMRMFPDLRNLIESGCGGVTLGSKSQVLRKIQPSSLLRRGELGFWAPSRMEREKMGLYLEKEQPKERQTILMRIALDEVNYVMV
ncbi:hypothetical protein BGX29_011381 [Mortierella sp. GBA35]|nr:hypothetical protein BGX29_011381 [Mortierella sp. GBA35]